MIRFLKASILLGVLVIGMLAVQPALGSEPVVAHAGGGSGASAGLTPAESAAESILFVVVDTGVVMLVLSFALCLFRIVRGPTLIDRGIATDTITLHVVGLAILLTISLRSLLYFDAVLIFAILGFATTVAFAQFIGRRRAV